MTRRRVTDLDDPERNDDNQYVTALTRAGNSRFEPSFRGRRADVNPGLCEDASIVLI